MTKHAALVDWAASFRYSRRLLGDHHIRALADWTTERAFPITCIAIVPE